MFSEEYFMYAEDFDLNFKVKQAGYTNYYVGETAIIHHGGRSSDSNGQPLVTPDAVLRNAYVLPQDNGRMHERSYQAAVGCADFAGLPW